MKALKPKGWLIDDGFNSVYTEAESNLSNAERFNWKITPLYESAGSKFPQIHTMQTKLDEQAKEIEKLKGALNAVVDLIDNSTGVAGLHQNGEVAEWDSILAGGHFEEWLIDLSEALK